MWPHTRPASSILGLRPGTPSAPRPQAFYASLPPVYGAPYAAPSVDGAASGQQPSWTPFGGTNYWDQAGLTNAFSTMTLQQPSPSGEWYMDSGATNHVTSDVGNLSHSHHTSSHTPSGIIVGNGATLPVTSTGSAILNFSRPLHLNHVLVSPNMIKNLVSVRRFTTDNSVSVEFDPFGLSVKDLTSRNVIARCDSTGDLYPLWTPTTSSPSPQALLAASTTVWHRRLGHPAPPLLLDYRLHQPLLRAVVAQSPFVMRVSLDAIFVYLLVIPTLVLLRISI
jgi:hypothetical protein